MSSDTSSCDSDGSYTKRRYNTDPLFRERMIASMRNYYDKVKDSEEYKAKRRQWSKAYYDRHPEVKELKMLQSAERRQRLKQA